MDHGHEVLAAHWQGAEKRFPAHTEVVYLPYQRGAPYPGLFLFTQTARMTRPVTHLATKSPVLVGTLEQLTLNIRCAQQQG